MRPRLAATLVVLIEMGSLVFAIAIHPGAASVLAQIFALPFLLGALVLGTIWHPPAVFRRIREGGPKEYNTARGVGAFWYGAFPPFASLVVSLGSVAPTVAACLILGVNTIIAFPVALAAEVAARRVDWHRLAIDPR